MRRVFIILEGPGALGIYCGGPSLDRGADKSRRKFLAGLTKFEASTSSRDSSTTYRTRMTAALSGNLDKLNLVAFNAFDYMKHLVVMQRINSNSDINFSGSYNNIHNIMINKFDNKIIVV